MKPFNFVLLISLLLSCSYTKMMSKELKELVTSTFGSTIDSKPEIPPTANQTFDNNYFAGNWLLYGYKCQEGKDPHPEKMHCVVANGEFHCKKTLGDACVKTGSETIFGKNPEHPKVGDKIITTFIVGSVEKPSAGKWKHHVFIRSIDEFGSGPRKYVRDHKQNELDNPKPHVDPVDPVDPVPPKPHVDPMPHLPEPPKTQVHKFVYYWHGYFLGNWNAIGYTCDKNTPQIEVINITYDKNHLVAKKITGDACVPAGQISFHGVLPVKFWQGETFNINFWIGTTSHPHSKEVQREIVIIDLNTFKIGDHTFYRQMGPNSPHPHGIYINMTPMIGTSRYDGIGYIKVNPRRNMRFPVRRYVIIEEDTQKPGNC